MKLRSASTALVLLALMALAVRLAAVFVLFDPQNGPRTYEHGAIAESLVAGDGFSITFLGVHGPTSQQAPLYPLALAGLYRIYGSGSAAALLTMQILQALAGTALVLVVFWLARSLVPAHRGVAWTAAIFAAVYPTHIYMVTHIQVVVWAALVLTTPLAVAASPRWRATRGGALLTGLLSGAALLIDPILALGLPFIAIYFWLGFRKQGSLWSRRAVTTSAIMPLVAAAVIAPWLVRNFAVHGEFVFVKSTFGYALWQGNNPRSWGTDKIPKPSAAQLAADHDGTLAGTNRALWEARHETLYIDDVLLKPHGYGRFAGLTEPARSRVLGDEARTWIANHPRAYAALCLQRLRYFLLFDETNPKTWHPVYRASTVCWLVLAVLGWLVSRPSWRALWPTWCTFAALTAFHALTIVSARFRIPVEPVTFVWIGMAVGPLLERLFVRERSPTHLQLPRSAESEEEHRRAA